MNRASNVIVAVLALGLVGGAALLWRHWPARPPAAAVPPTVAESPLPVPPPAGPTIKYPIEAVAGAEPSAAGVDVGTALSRLFGRKVVLSMFQLEDFPRRFVATVDNLGRSHAPARLWPVNPPGGRFTVERQDTADVASADNELRYAPFVLLIETVDMREAIAAYVQLYPLFQHAYEDLGYPNRNFNDRLVDVIDQLLATPDANVPAKVRLPEINGPVRPERPWVLYEFDDPALQLLSSGQKILVRIGPVNERRMKAKLAEIRRLLTAPATRR